MKYALPTDDGKTVGKVFGRAKGFAIYDDTDSSYVIAENSEIGSEHGAGTGTAAFLAETGIAIVIAPEIGPKAAEALERAGIKIVITKAGMALGEAMADAIVQSK